MVPQYPYLTGKRWRPAACICCLLGCAGLCRAAVDAYEFPPEAAKAPDFTVTVDGKPVLVYDTKVGAIVSFGLSGRAEVRIRPISPFKKASIRPTSRNVAHTIDQGVITCTLEGVQQVGVELDGNTARPLFIFANPPEQPPARRDDPGLVYFAPGRIHQAGEIKLKSGQTAYLAGGAVVQGFITADNAERIRILGPGILDGSYEQTKKHNMISIGRCTGVEIRDLMIVDAFGWTVHLRQSTDIQVDNLKEVGWRANSDGIDVNASRQVTVNRSFIRTGDDKVAIKCMYDVKGYRTVEDVTFQGCTFWGPCRGLEIGFELRGEAVRRLLFRDCDIVHSTNCECFSVHNGDTAVVEDVRCEDIRVEGARSVFAELRVGLTPYSADFPQEYRKELKELPKGLIDWSTGGSAFRWFQPPDRSLYAARRGSIRRVVFDRIRFIESPFLPVILIGYDDQHGIDDVRFTGMSMAGKPIPGWPADKWKTQFATNIRCTE